MQLLCIFTPATTAKKQAEEERRVCWFQPRPDRSAERPNWPSASLCIYPTGALFNAPLPSSRGTEAPGRPPICHLRWRRPGDRLGWGPAFALAGKNQGEGRERRSTIARVRKSASSESQALQALAPPAEAAAARRRCGGAARRRGGASPG